MASAPTLVPSSKETTNYARLCRLLVEGGTKALRYTFDKFHSPANLCNILKPGSPEHKKLKKLKEEGIINATQWGKLYPSRPSHVTSKDFDITLLFVLLRNICGRTAPASTNSWDRLPPVRDSSVEANMVRVKFYRNSVYGHAINASVDDPTFNSLWRNIGTALIALGVEEAAIHNLKTDSMDPVMEEHYQGLLKEWKKDEDNIKDKLDKLEDEIKGISSEVGNISKKLETSATKTEDAIKDIRDEIGSVSRNLMDTLETSASKSEELMREHQMRRREMENICEKIAEEGDKARKDLSHMKSGIENISETLQTALKASPIKGKGNAVSADRGASLLDCSVRKAESYNSRGKVEFQEKRYEDACQQYSYALECLPRDQEDDNRVKYLCNRAACHVRLSKFKDALEDCEQALLINPQITKARFRRVQALQGEGRIAEAFTEVTSLREKIPEEPRVAQLAESLKKEVENAKEKAITMIQLGIGCFQRSSFDEAIQHFSEGILLLPKLDMYVKERKKFYWMRAQCQLNKKELNAALRDCEEADRLVSEDGLVLNTMRTVLEGLNKYEECYNICNRLIEKNVKVAEAEETITRLLPKIFKEEKKVEGQSPEATNPKKSKRKKRGSKKRKGTEKEKEKDYDHEGILEEQEAVPTKGDVKSSECSTTDGSLPDEGGGIEEDNSTVNRMLPDKELIQDGLHVGGTTVKMESELSNIETTKWPDSKVFTETDDESSQTRKTVLYACKTQEDEFVFNAEQVSDPPELNLTFSESLTGCAYPRQILMICDKWSCWHQSVCSVNKQLSRSFAKGKDVNVACLVLDATEQDTSAAAKEGVNLIKATPQPGMCQGDKQLLSLHSDYPFKVDLVVGHGMLSGAAAAIQAKRENCKRLHIFHDLPGTDGKERDIGLEADFVAGIGPLVVEQWKAILNREVFTIIPGIPPVAPRNQIMTPQCRCLFLGNVNNPSESSLRLVTDALADCKQGNISLHLTVVGSERENVEDLNKEIRNVLCSSKVEAVVRPLDISQEAVGVEVRGVSLVLIPSPTDGFGMMALKAIAAKVPILIPSSCGVARFLKKAFGDQFLKLLCSTEGEWDGIDAWTYAINEIFDDREEAFDMAASLCEKWNSTYTWDSTAELLLKHLGSSGKFSLLPASANKKIKLPSQCPTSAIRFIEEEVELLNRCRQHVLFLSPENVNDSPFIHYFSQVPWAAVLDFDVNSANTGFLAGCETFCENMGMKICRILPPSADENRRKSTVLLPNGIPWVLLEGMPESKRSTNDNLEWVREFFLALGKSHQVPLTFLVLWNSVKETETLCKHLFTILTVVRSLPLYSQVKLVIASTGDLVSTPLEYLADGWKVDVKRISLEDVCNALFLSVSSSPFVQENQDFSLPVADPEDPQKVSFKILPPTSRWVNAEMEVLYKSVGSTPQFETDDACHFYRGGLISWYALRMGYAIKRTNWMALKARIDDLLLKAGSVTLKMPHQRGAGGTTTARKILFDYHERYPCVVLKSVGHSEVAEGIKVLAEFCKLPIIILSDFKLSQSDEFDGDTLFNILSNDRIPCIILSVIHQSPRKSENPSRSSGKSEKTLPIRLASDLDVHEAQEFVEIYGTQKKEKLGQLRALLDRSKELQIPFYYALTTFEEKFTGLKPFVADCIQGLDLTQRKILVFLALAYHYGHNSLPSNDFAGILQVPRRVVISLESVLPGFSRELLLEEDGRWRPRHDLIAMEMLRQLLTMPGPEGSPPMHPDNWKSQLPETALDFLGHMRETVVSDVLLSRVSNDAYFSQLIYDIPFEDDAIKLFEKAISLFPNEPFFKVYLGRVYSIQKKSAGFSMAIKYTDGGINCSQGYPSRKRGLFAQMKGMVYSREVDYLMDQNAEIKSIAEMACDGVANFRRAVSLAPDINGYMPEVRMMCKVFEYIDNKTGNFFDYAKSADADPFIIDAIHGTSDTLERVPDSDVYLHWRMRLTCLGRRNFSPRKEKETLEFLYDLRKSGRASRGSINRQIVIMKRDICLKNGDSLSVVAPELIDLLNEAMKYDNIEQTMRLWVRLAPFIPVPLSEAEDKVFHWSSRSKSVRSYLYKYIIACVHVLEGGSSSYSEIMKNAFEDLNSEIKAINRDDVGRFRHPDRPVVWLGNGIGMGHLVYLDDKSSAPKDVRKTRFIESKFTKQLRHLTGLIVKTGPKVGKIRTNGDLDVSFRADLCEPPLVSQAFAYKRVKFYLSFTFFGTDAYNVNLVDE